MASARQILRTDFGYCADFPGGCFVPSVLSVSLGNAKIRAEHRCPARMGRENLFRGLLFCDCCGHPLTLSRKKLKDREVDIYLCTHHNRRPDECPQTHIIYHEVLYPYVLELTPEILREVVDQIMIKHVQRNAKPTKVIRLYWQI